MNLKQNIFDIYTKSSVYYFRLPYMVICYLLVLVIAFCVFPMLREIGINGTTRLLLGSALYIGFVILLILSPHWFLSFFSKFIYPYKDTEEIKEEFNRLSEKEKEKEKIIFTQRIVNKRAVATNIFFQCLLMELFCLTVLINTDYSLLISNPITQYIANVLQTYTDSTPPNYNDAFFGIYDGHSMHPFGEFAYMAESIFFIYIVFLLSFTIRLISLFIIARPFFNSNFFHVITDIHNQEVFVRGHIFKTIRNIFELVLRVFWAILATFVLIFGVLIILHVGIRSLDIYILLIKNVGNIFDVFNIINRIFGLRYYAKSIVFIKSWWIYSLLFMNLAMCTILCFFRFMKDWYKLIFRKF